MNISDSAGQLTSKDGVGVFYSFSKLLKKFRTYSNQSKKITKYEPIGMVQLHSPLLCLPREVRDMIWKELMTGMFIHLWIDENYGHKLKGSFCRAEKDDCRHRCRDWLEKKGDMKWPMIGVLGVLLSCVQSYTESIKFLYEGNSFDARLPEVICQLPNVWAPKNINTIRTLTLCWSLPKPPSLSNSARQFYLEGNSRKAVKGCTRYQKEWIMTWDALSKLNGLNFLRIEMNLTRREAITGVWEASDLEIMKIVTTPSVFIVITDDEKAKRLGELVRAPNLTIRGILCDEEF
ncbi:hypothetical protein VTL71DRAFT_16 [Oculimacula yallundae]|uniref:DUF7730 domain-containing protein n=1 Tax=Oculimacula yallundae TaxID=86028 RepID=A0ABR4CYT5_9HELO